MACGNPHSESKAEQARESREPVSRPEASSAEKSESKTSRLEGGKAFHHYRQEVLAARHSQATFIEGKTTFQAGLTKESGKRGFADFLGSVAEREFALGELKMTNWDALKDPDRTLASHLRQVDSYIHGATLYDKGSKEPLIVYPFIEYPERPSPELAEKIERAFGERCVLVKWLDDARWSDEADL